MTTKHLDTSLATTFDPQSIRADSGSGLTTADALPTVAGAASTGRLRSVFSFPETVNEYAARSVAAGVVILAATTLVTGWHWLLVPLVYGFWARLLTGPTLSPLGQLATRVVVPGLRLPNVPTPGAPKRFAQGIGATLTTAALVAWLLGAVTVVQVLIAMLVLAASLEAVIGFCLGCYIFGQLMRVGVIPEGVCEDCADIWSRIERPVEQS